VAFSYDNIQVVSGSSDKTIKIWNVDSGICLKTLNIGQVVYNITFDMTSLYILIDADIISWDMSSNSKTVLVATASEEFQYYGYGINTDHR
jgi:WD40 repeat protein